MSYIDWKKLKERVSLRDILDHYDLLSDLEEAPHGYAGSCPFCGSNAFKVNVEKNAWFCFGDCKEAAEVNGTHNGGNILDFVARLEEVSVKTGAEKIAAWFPEEPVKAGRGGRPTRGRMPDKGRGQEVPHKVEPPRAKVQAASKEGTASEEGSASAPPDVKVVALPESCAALESPEDFVGRVNPPLPFMLKSLVAEHPALTALGIARETLETFGVGFFTGKGLMHGKVVVPFYNPDGQLIAYVGYAPGDGKPLYPKEFDRRLELFNALRAENLGLFKEGLVLVTDILQVILLHDLGVYNAIALPSAGLHLPQVALMEAMVGEGGQVDFIPGDQPVMETLATLAARFYTRVHRDLAGSPAEFLPKIATKLGCS